MEGCLSTQQWIATLVITAIMLLGVCWLMPKRVGYLIPNALIQSRVFNWLVLLSILGGWLLFVIVVGVVANEDTSSTSNGTALGLAIVIAAVYLVWLAVGSFVAATWAWLCLRSELANHPRKLGIAQMLCATPGVLFGLVAAVWLSTQN